jgi:hypothetical protein
VSQQQLFAATVAIQARFKGFGFPDQDQRALADLPDGSECSREIAPRCLYCEAVDREWQADIINLVSICQPDFGFDGLARLSIPYSQKQPRRAVKGFLVPEEHHFAAGLDLMPVGFERNRSHRRRRGFGELFLGCLADVWAGRKLHLLGSQLHGKGQAGRKTAVLAVGLG